MSKFKGTKAPWFATEFSGYWRIMDGYYYEDNDIMDQDSCIHAEKNAQLASCAPELLEALINLCEQFKKVDKLYSRDKLLISKADEAINKALTPSLKEINKEKR